jgi:hypothetical protein
MSKTIKLYILIYPPNHWPTCINLCHHPGSHRHVSSGITPPPPPPPPPQKKYPTRTFHTQTSSWVVSVPIYAKIPVWKYPSQVYMFSRSIMFNPYSDQYQSSKIPMYTHFSRWIQVNTWCWSTQAVPRLFNRGTWPILPRNSLQHQPRCSPGRRTTSEKLRDRPQPWSPFFWGWCQPIHKLLNHGFYG